MGMSVYKKLNAAREEFHAAQIKKSGRNTFAGYDYFELGDFIVPALSIFNKHGLAGVVSFGTEIATLAIVDVENPQDRIEITSPMSEASLKGCHAVQNLGAVETYIRRYLWVAALEIVEHDAVDSGPGVEKEKGPDVAAILRGITNAQTLEILKSNYEAAMQMLPQAHQAAIKKATNARKAELTQKENA
jgi:hypothetical protein